MTLALDDLSLEDVPTVAAIEAQRHLTPWGMQSFQDALRSGWHARVLRDPQLPGVPLLGYFVSMTTGDDEELLTITVAPNYEGCGYGRVLLSELIREARARGAERLFLEVRESNRRAIHLYESAGFTMSGMRKNYYAVPANLPSHQPAGRENALLMVLSLQGPQS